MKSHEAIISIIKRLLKWLMFKGLNLSTSAIIIVISLDLKESGSSKLIARPKILKFYYNLVEEDVKQDRFQLAYLSIK